MEVVTNMSTSAADSKETELFRLIRGVQAGDHVSFEFLYQATGPSVRRLIASLERDPSTAEDLVQETFELIWTKIGLLREPATFWGWVRRIAVNLTVRRQQQREKKGWLSLLSGAGREPTVDPLAGVPQRLDLEAGLARLAPADRAVLVLREMHGLSYEELAEALELPIGTVKSRLHSARKKILEQLKKKGSTHA